MFRSKGGGILAAGMLLTNIHAVTDVQVSLEEVDHAPDRATAYATIPKMLAELGMTPV